MVEWGQYAQAYKAIHDAILNVFAEVIVVKPEEVKVTKIFLMLGNLAIQLTGD